MVSITELARKPSEFQRTTGVSYATFRIILGKAEAYVGQSSTLSTEEGASRPLTWGRP